MIVHGGLARKDVANVQSHGFSRSAHHVHLSLTVGDSSRAREHSSGLVDDLHLETNGELMGHAKKNTLTSLDDKTEC